MENLIASLKRHNAYRYLIYHILGILILFTAFGKPDVYGGGPCNAGIELILDMPVILANLILALISAVKLITKSRDYAPQFWVNSMGFCFWVAFVFVRW